MRLLCRAKITLSSIFCENLKNGRARRRLLRRFSFSLTKINIDLRNTLF